MTSRERITLALNHKEADRVAIHGSPWGTTAKRWHKEGLPEDKSPDEYFDYELKGFSCDTSFQLPEEVIEEEIKTKITFAKKGGGYIYHSDHSVPDDVSFENYKKVISLVLKYGKY